MWFSFGVFGSAIGGLFWRSFARSHCVNLSFFNVARVRILRPCSLRNLFDRVVKPIYFKTEAMLFMHRLRSLAATDVRDILWKHYYAKMGPTIDGKIVALRVIQRRGRLANKQTRSRRCVCDIEPSYSAVANPLESARFSQSRPKCSFSINPRGQYVTARTKSAF